jgi:hypothetical protein
MINIYIECLMKIFHSTYLREYVVKTYFTAKRKHASRRQKL